jgi:hypothetical protein
MPKRTYSTAVKSQALELVDTLGYALASKQTTIPQPTLRAWVSHRAGRGKLYVPPDVPEIDASPDVTWDDSVVSMANRFGRLAGGMLSSAEGFARQGRPREAKEAILAAAIAVDKAELLSGRATKRSESRSIMARLTPTQVRELSARQAASKGLGIPSELPPDQLVQLAIDAVSSDTTDGY